MNKREKNIRLILLLIAISLFIYLLQTLIFHDPKNGLFYLFQDLAFLPFQIALVTFGINRFLNSIEEEKKQKKIHVVITTFFIEVGTMILKEMAKFDLNHEHTTEEVKKLTFSKKNEKQVMQVIDSLDLKMYADPSRIPELKALMDEKKNFMLEMLENSNLLEHDSFTDMLWAVFHVADELQMRKIEKLDEEDISHLSVDLNRAYKGLLHEWAQYLMYLEREYPFLYVIAIKKTAFK